jgi:hypothetical protein
METAAELVSFPRWDSLPLTKATDVQTMFQSGRSSIVTGGQDLFIFDQHSPYLPPQASGPLGNEMSNIHEILFPGGPTKRKPFFLFCFQG